MLLIPLNVPFNIKMGTKPQCREALKGEAGSCALFSGVIFYYPSTSICGRKNHS